MTNDSGNATVLAVGIIGALASVGLVIVAVIATVTDSHRSQLAADLAAVSAAYAVYYGNDACAVARETAQVNHARLTTCEAKDGDVVVGVKAGRREARARAGPL